MSRFYEPAQEEVSKLRIERRRSRRRAWRDGLADQTVVNDFEDIRSYRAFERALVGSVDPRAQHHDLATHSTKGARTWNCAHDQSDSRPLASGA